MKSKITLLWHDYETWGVNPRVDRAAQFASIRTNTNLEEVGKPQLLYCRPADDFLPNPEAVLVTGITPQLATEKGIDEASFFQQINEEFSRPGTCGTGYNSIRFDDEVTRFGFYRNFIDPYAREWQNGNKRWDILDLARMAHALRPEGINWPKREDGSTSFRLEDLTAANEIEHQGAHDALVDVRATIALARLIKEHQPRLYDYFFAFRDKARAAQELDLTGHGIVLHISGMYPASQGCIAPVVPLMIHPVNKNQVIAYDLRKNPQAMLAMSPEEIAEKLYARQEDLEEGEERIGLKGIHLNKSPALAPVATLNPEMAEKWQLDWDQVEEHRQQLLADSGLVKKLGQLYAQAPDYEPVDADSGLYSGGFISNHDRRLCDEVLQKTPDQLSQWIPQFEDVRLQTLFPRYRARNWPESLTEDERQQWKAFCEERLLAGGFGNTLTLQRYQETLEQLLTQPIPAEKEFLFKQLVDWVQ